MDHKINSALREAKKLVSALEGFKGTAAEHLALLTQTEKVRAEIEEPYDFAARLLEELTLTGALYTLSRLGVLDKIPTDGSSISAAALAAATNVDASAITRSMRVLLVKGIAFETAPDEYTHNTLSKACLAKESDGALFLLSMDLSKSFVALPEYFKSHNPEDLYDIKKSPFSFSVGKEGMSYYEVLNLDVDQRDIWNRALQQAEKNMPVLGMFPFASLEEQVKKEPERPFIVDIAGGRGQALLAIQTECPGAFGGKLILQDLPIVIDSLKPEEVNGIEPTVYDIFTPQPVKSKFIFIISRLGRRMWRFC